MIPSNSFSDDALTLEEGMTTETAVAMALSDSRPLAPMSDEPEAIALANGVAHRVFQQTRPQQVPILDEEMPNCNDNCIHCGVADIMANARTITFSEIVAHLEGLRRTGADAVMFAVSELTIRPDFIRIVRTAKARGFTTIAVVTNARRMAYLEFTRSVVEAGATHFLVSVYGATARVHESMTRTPQSFEQTIQGLDHLLAHDVKVMTNTVITRRNVDSLGEIVGFLGDRGVTRSCLSLVQIIGNAEKHVDRLLVRMEDAAVAVRKAVEEGHSRGMLMGIGGMPYCQLPDLEGCFGVDDLSVIHNADERDQITSKSPYAASRMCSTCRYVAVCPGVQEAYLEREGDAELRPVGGPRLTRRPLSELGVGMFPQLFHPWTGDSGDFKV